MIVLCLCLRRKRILYYRDLQVLVRRLRLSDWLILSWFKITLSSSPYSIYRNKQLPHLLTILISFCLFLSYMTNVHGITPWTFYCMRFLPFAHIPHHLDVSDLHYQTHLAFYVHRKYLYQNQLRHQFHPLYESIH